MMTITVSTAILTKPLAKVELIKLIHLPCSKPSHCVQARCTGMQCKLSTRIQTTATAEFRAIIV